MKLLISVQLVGIVMNVLWRSIYDWQAPARISNDFGALCPQFDRPEQGLDLLQEAITSLGLSPGVDFHLALNCAAHEAFDFVSYTESSANVVYDAGWPLVWKTWKCQGIWQLSGKCQGFYWKSGKCQRIVREKILSGKSCLRLFIVNCIFVSIQVFSRSLLRLKC